MLAVLLNVNVFIGQLNNSTYFVLYCYS